MFKRILSMILCITLVCLIAMPVTAEETKETTETTRSMEEILNDFHARSTALTTASANSRSASTDQKAQLKQETIAELNAAGYSAYDVNSTTYNDLEETLQTDFSQMGLDPNGSYIIVISGEEEKETPANGARGSGLLLPPHLYEPDKPVGGDTFTYTYDGTIYLMRYVTVLPVEGDNLVDAKSVDFPPENNSLIGELLLNSGIQLFEDKTKIPLGTVLDFLSNVITYDITHNSSSVQLHLMAEWSYREIQVYLDSDNGWFSAQRSYSVNITSSFMGQVYDYSLNRAVQYVGPQFIEEIKSEEYDNLEDLKEYAAIAFNGLYTSEDNIGDIPVYHEGIRVYTFYEPDIV